MTRYAEPEELRDATNKTVTADDPVLADLLDAASQLIDRFCNRPDGFLALALAAVTTRTYTGTGKGVQWIDECVAVTEVAVKESVTDTTYTVWPSTDYLTFTGDETDPDFTSLPITGLLIDPSGDQAYFLSGQYTALRGFPPDPDTRRLAAPTVRVKARWGYALETPPLVKTATIAQAAIWYKRGQSSWGDVVGSAELGTLTFSSLDSKIEAMLTKGRLVRPAVGRR